MKVLFYSHNVWGLGHIVRSLRIAEAAAKTGQCDCVLMTGCHFLNTLEIDPRIKIEKLPAAKTKGIRFVAYEDESDTSIILRRSKQILDFCREWKPDVVLVDHEFMGLGGELLDTLMAAKKENWQTKFILGVPYYRLSSDENGETLKVPKNPRVKKALSTYHSVIAYTDEKFVNTLDSYKDSGFPELQKHVGFVVGKVPKIKPADPPVVVGLCGGGWDSDHLLDMLVEVTKTLTQNNKLKLRFVTGPFGHADIAREKTKGLKNIEIWETGSVEEAIQDASLAVARMGYNTAYSLVQTELPLIFAPLPTPCDEQYARAKQLEKLDRIWCIDEREDNVKDRLMTYLDLGLSSDLKPRTLPFSIEGAQMATNWILEYAKSSGR